MRLRRVLVASVLAFAALAAPVAAGDEQSPTEIRFTLHPLIAGLEAGLDPVSLLDFVAGFFFIDIEGDDVK